MGEQHEKHQQKTTPAFTFKASFFLLEVLPFWKHFFSLVWKPLQTFGLLEFLSSFSSIREKNLLNIFRLISAINDEILRFSLPFSFSSSELCSNRIIIFDILYTNLLPTWHYEKKRHSIFFCNFILERFHFGIIKFDRFPQFWQKICSWCPFFTSYFFPLIQADQFLSKICFLWHF